MYNSIKNTLINEKLINLNQKCNYLKNIIITTVYKLN